MTHPDLQGLDRDPGVIAHGAEGHTEIMTTDPDVPPGRKRFSLCEECFMLLRLSVPAGWAAVQLSLQEGDVGLVLPGKGHQGHHGTVLFRAQQPVMESQRIGEAVIQRDAYKYMRI